MGPSRRRSNTTDIHGKNKHLAVQLLAKQAQFVALLTYELYQEKIGNFFLPNSMGLRQFKKGCYHPGRSFIC